MGSPNIFDLDGTTEDRSACSRFFICCKSSCKAEFYEPLSMFLYDTEDRTCDHRAMFFGRN